MSVSVCQLSVNESRGAVKSYTEWNCSEYVRYAHLPVKGHNNYYTISDVIANSQAINGDVISIMAVVKHVRVFLSLSLLCHVMNWPVINIKCYHCSAESCHSRTLSCSLQQKINLLKLLVHSVMDNTKGNQLTQYAPPCLKPELDMCWSIHGLGWVGKCG